jgi:hypothetical protein
MKCPTFRNFLTLGVLFAAALYPQIGGTGSIQGTIKDSSGAILPDANVVATHVATGVKTSRQTTAAGLFVLSGLQPGEYTVAVSANGFQTAVQQKVIVDALDAVGLNIALQVGATTDSVNVSAAPAQLNTVDARMGQTMRGETYSTLPLQMGLSGIGAGPRNPQSFIYLMPGVQEGNRWGTINGSQGFAKEVYVEGVPITDPIQQGEGRSINLGISVDAVEQFQVETSGTGVEFGGQGAENYVLKSGTNEFHGSLYEYLRNTKLDARPFFSPLRPKENQNEFGGTVGGPIKRNKIFFFGVYNAWRYRVATDSRLMTIPTLKMRAGDFSELPVQIFDPRTTLPLAGGGYSRQPYAGNLIPASQTSKISQFLQAPLPQPTSGGIANNYLGQLPVGYNNDNYTGKLDFVLTDAHRLTGTFTHGKRTQPGPYREVVNPIPLPYTDTRLVEEIPTIAQVKHNWVVSSTLLNQLSFGFNRLAIPIINVTTDGQWMSKAGMKGLPQGDAINAFPRITWAGPNAPLEFRGGGSAAFQDVNNSFTLQDSLQWIHGKHSFKFGFQHQRLQDNFRANTTGTLFTPSFSNTQTMGFNATGGSLTTTGNAYASFLLGAMNGASLADDFVVTLGARFRSNSFWVSDDFKITSRLTLNLGLRWDIFNPYEEVVDRFSYLDPNAPNPAAGGRPGALRYGGTVAGAKLSCNCDTPINKFYGALGPRLGFAYSLNEKTTVRGAFGIMYTRRGAVGGREGARDGTGTVGFNPNAVLASPDGGISPSLYWENGIPAYQKGPIYDETYQTGFNGAGTGGAVTYGNPDSQPPRYQNWNFSIQRSISKSMTLTAAYVGSNGKYLAGAGRGQWSNQIHPRFLALGNLLTSTATPANVAAARAIMPEVALPFPTFSGTIAQMLRPFPQYNSFGDPYGNVGQSNYNAMQLVVQQRFSTGLTFSLNYTFSKSINNVSGGRSAYAWQDAKTISNVDQPHIFNGIFSYDLPYGKGRPNNPENRFVRALASDWKISGITRFATGVPLGTIAAACNVPQAGGCWSSYDRNFTGDVRINGEWGDGNVVSGTTTAFLDVRAFKSPAAFTYGDTPPTMAFNLRNPSLFNQDLSLRRDFPITEKVKFTLQGDAFNAFNNVRFGGINLNITNAAFGKVSSQVNTPRAVQFSARISF